MKSLTKEVEIPTILTYDTIGRKFYISQCVADMFGIREGEAFKDNRTCDLASVLQGVYEEKAIKLTIEVQREERNTLIWAFYMGCLLTIIACSGWAYFSSL